MSRIFLSHSSRDNAHALALNRWLQDNGWDDVFLDVDPERGIQAGERWERALNEAADRCEAVLFLVSEAWLASEWCHRELNLALRLNKQMFGILIEDIALPRLPPELTRSFQIVNLAVGSDGAVRRVDMPARGAEEHVVFSRSGLDRLRLGLVKAGLDPRFFEWPPKGEPDRPPWRGLRPLEAEDAGIFFGRDAPLIQTLDALRGLAAEPPRRFLVILGASGAGKSSFLRAGLLPRLARDDRNFLALPVLRPERAALSGEQGLVRSIERAFEARKRPRNRAVIRAAAATPDGDALPGLFAELADAARVEGKAPALVIAVDQAEELFQAAGRDESELLLRHLANLAAAATPRCLVIFTIRSDAYEPLQTEPALATLAPAIVSLPPIPAGAWSVIIEGPIKRLADAKRPLKIEPALTERLLADLEAGGGKDALPLLSFTLERLYTDYGGDGDLRLEEYDAFGGVAGAIDAAVAAAMRRADADPRVPADKAARQALMRRAFIPWLCGIDPATGTPRRAVARLGDIPQEARPIVEHLVDARLLTVNATAEGGNTIEPAHEALLRQWGLLEGWLAEDLGFLAILEAVKRASRDWLANARNAAWLDHRGNRLEEAERLDTRPDLAAKLDPDDRAYLASCRAAENAETNRKVAQARRIRIWSAAATVLAVLALIAAGYGFYNARQANVARHEAETQAAIATAQTKLAEARQKDAEAQKAEAVRQAGIATEQTKLAEARQKDAEAQKAEAERQKTRAEKVLAAATATANSLIFDLANKFSNVQGVPLTVVRDILGKAQDLQAQLAAAGEQSPDLQQQSVAALTFIVNTLLAMGDTKGALDAARKSVAIMEKLAADDPANTLWQRDLSVSYNNVGSVQQAQGDLAGALASYRKGLVIAEKLAGADPSNTLWQRDLSVSYERVGEVQQAQGDLAGALESYRKGLDIVEKLAAADPSNTLLQRDLSVGRNKIGDVQQTQGDLTGALQNYREGLAVIEKLAAADPSNTLWQRDLSISYSEIGGVQQAQGDLAGALESFRHRLAIAEKLTATDPSNTEWQRDLSISHNKVGDVQQAQGDLAGALASYRDSLAIVEKLSAADPANTGWRRDLSISHNNVGDVQQAQGDIAGALQNYREGLAIIEKLAATDPSNSQWQRDLSISYGEVGDAQQVQGDFAGALISYRNSLAIRERLAAADPSNTLWQRDLSINHNNLGDVQQAQGDLAGALQNYRDGLAIIAKLAAADPSNTLWQRDLSISNSKIGDVQRVQGDLAGARTSYRNSLAIAEKLAAADLSNMQWQRDLSVGYWKLAAAGESPRDNYGKALAILLKLKADGHLARSDERYIATLQDLIAKLPP